MKVLVVNNYFPPDSRGGAEISVAILASAYVRLGLDTVVVALGAEDGVEKYGGLRVRRLRPGNRHLLPRDGIRGAARRVRWHVEDVFSRYMGQAVGCILDAERPDVVHTNNLQGFSVAVWREAASRQIPIVHTIRDYYLLCPRTTMFRNGRRCVRRCASCTLLSYPKRLESMQVDAVVGLSQCVLTAHTKRGYFRRARERVIPNGVSAPDGTRRLMDARANEIVFAYLGQIAPHKGVEQLVGEFPKGGGARLLIFGRASDPTYLRHLKGIAHGAVEFPGVIGATEAIERADVVVVPSVWDEPFGRVVIEAYALGRPVIAAARCGLVELVRHGATGLIYDPDEPGMLRAAIDVFLANPGLARRLAVACWHEARRFDPNAIGQRYIELFLECMADRS